MRLDKLLSDAAGLGRSGARDAIRSGRVSVNGRTQTRPETKLDPESDVVSLDGSALSYQRFVTLMLYKPLGCVTATEDRREKTVLDLLPPSLKKLGLFPVGRLDKDTSGLLLLTNDGDFAHRVISPKNAIEKCYDATVEGRLTDEDVEAFRTGLTLGDGTRCLPARLELSGPDRCRVTVVEGKYHQVRRMLASRGAPVKTLERVSVGGLLLDPELRPGEWRELDENDLCRVFMGI